MANTTHTQTPDPQNARARAYTQIERRRAHPMSDPKVKAMTRARGSDGAAPLTRYVSIEMMDRQRRG